MNEYVHVAITRRVKAGHEAEYEKALREFVQASFNHAGVLGAGMLVPLSGSNSRDYGILRTFTTERERDLFYESADFKAWEERVRPWTEGEPVHRRLHGLEAWFRNPGQPNPPQWKMAVATYLGVVPVIMFLSLTLGRWTHNWNFVLNNLVFNAFVVALLTWVVMPVITRALNSWLRSE